MIDINAMVRRERLRCDSDCSYQLNLKRYREHRKNLGELNRLARSKPRPLIIIPERSQPQPVVAESAVAVRREPVSELPKADPEPEPEPEPAESVVSDDDEIEWFDTADIVQKRMFGSDDTLYMKRLMTGRREELDAMKAAQELKVMEDMEIIKQHARELDAETERRTATAQVRASVREWRDTHVRNVREDIARYEQYRKSAPYIETIRPALDEFYERQREDIGRLEELR